jgi:hypothetical protein
MLTSHWNQGKIGLIQLVPLFNAAIYRPVVQENGENCDFVQGYI